MTLLESDWKKYSKIFDYVIERYYQKINENIQNILNSTDYSEQDKNYLIYELTKATEKIVKKYYINHARSKCYHNVIFMISDKILTYDDITDFSEEFKTRVKRFLEGPE